MVAAWRRRAGGSSMATRNSNQQSSAANIAAAGGSKHQAATAAAGAAALKNLHDKIFPYMASYGIIILASYISTPVLLGATGYRNAERNEHEYKALP
jgi:hypothetical protein